MPATPIATRNGSPTRPSALALPLLFWLVFAAGTAHGDLPDPAQRVQQALAAACDEPPSSLSELAGRIPGSSGLSDEPLTARGTDVGWRRRLALPDGGELRMERFAPGGTLRRMLVAYWTAAPDGGTRPRLAAMAGAGCDILAGRRLVYGPDFPHALAIEHLDDRLAATGEREPLNPPVPPGDDPGGVRVALVDAGVNYLLPDIGPRLARDAQGAIVGHDYWDLDPRPFDANPARSPFFPQRHGTRTAALLLREAPEASLVPYRYPRPDMSRMTALIDAAAAAGVAIVNLSMGSGERDEWAAFAAAARDHPDMLFVLSAGNDGRDIDDRPVYPAALELDNTITVTSADDDGSLAPGSNRGRRSVDLMVPAERVVVTRFDGSTAPASGSSYAAVRISALAARLRARNPDWQAAELKAAIRARVLPAFDGDTDDTAWGFMPRPDKAEALPPLRGDGEPREAGRHTLSGEALYSGRPGLSGDHLFRPTFAYFEDTEWNPDRLRRHARQAAAILAHCGIRIPEIAVHSLDGPVVYRYFHDTIGKALATRLALPKPTVYFVRDTLQVEPFDAEAIGKGNSATRPDLRYTIWFTEGTRDPGIALAHELTHLLMDSGRHVDQPGNLMRAETAPENTRLTPQQCEAMITQGTENGLLTAAPG